MTSNQTNAILNGTSSSPNTVATDLSIAGRQNLVTIPITIEIIQLNIHFNNEKRDGFVSHNDLLRSHTETDIAPIAKKGTMNSRVADLAF